MRRDTILLDLISILSDGKFYSSKSLENRLGINHTMIDEYIKTLLEWGVNVFFIPEIGYWLHEPIQLLNEKLIQRQIKKSSVTVFSVINSTNQYLLDNLSILRSGDTCIAEHQQEGRGRHGRKWFSPFGSNLYLSMYWYLKKRSSEIVCLNLVISVVIAKVFHSLGADQVRIKWPNDLYFLDRKLAGILMELKSKTDKNNTAQIVIGIGINLKMQSTKADDEINQRWINLQEAGVVIDRNNLAIQIIKELQVALESFEQKGIFPFLSSLRKLNNFINRPVKLIIGNKEIYGISKGISEKGALLLEQNNIVKSWIGGEISLRSA